MLRRSWVAAVLCLGGLYCLVGVVFARPTTHVQMWRLAAWAVSAVGYAAHIVYERFRLRSSLRAGALHVAMAAALGAFGLAVAANIHSLTVTLTDEHRRLLLLALAIWPVMTGLPAFLVSLVAGWVLGYLRPRGA